MLVVASRKHVPAQHLPSQYLQCALTSSLVIPLTQALDMHARRAMCDWQQLASEGNRYDSANPCSQGRKPCMLGLKPYPPLPRGQHCWSPLSGSSTQRPLVEEQHFPEQYPSEPASPFCRTSHARQSSRR